MKSKMKEPFVSVIVNFYNSRSTLKECLDSIFKVKYKNYEVIAVDDCSTDDSAEIAKKYPVKYFKTPKNSGVAGSRNFGIKKAKGEIILITDSDCVLDQNWISEMVKPFEDKKVAVVGCRDRAPENDSFFAKGVDYALTSFIGTGGIRSKSKVNLSNYSPRGFSFCVRKELFDKYGYFDTNIVPGEEIDFGLRIKKAGYKLAFVSSTVVLHKRRPTLKAYAKQMYRRGYARLMLIKKHRKYNEILYAMPGLFVLGLIVLGILSFFSKLMLGIFTIIISVYVAALVISGIHSITKTKDIKSLLVVPFIIFLQHFLYGIGFLKALFRIGKLHDKRDEKGI